jgi:hypothetical protein
MPTNRRIFSQDAAVSAGDADAAQGLVLHLDANDEDSIESGGANTGNGSGTWFDIANHDLNVPLIDKGTDLVLHLNASDTTSYGGSGTTWTDLSSDGNNGTIDGATFGSDTRGYFTFDGTNDEVEVGADTDLSNNANNFSAEVWFNADSVSGTEYIFYQNNGTAGADHQFIIWRSSSNVFIYVYGSSVTTLESLGGFTQGEWSHIAFTFDGSNVKGYVNGTLKQTTARTDNANTSTDGEIYLGSNGTTNFFTGKIAVARYYKTALTDSEIAQNFRADCFLSYSSIYSTDLAIHLDAADDTTVSATTWSDKANSNNATIGSSVGFSSTLSDYYDKELGNWLVLDGSDDNMTISSNSSFQNATAFSVEMWIEPISIAADEMLSTLYTSGSDFKWDLRFDTGGVLRWIVGTSSGGGSSNQDLTTTDTLSTGIWQHIVATYDDSADTMKIYINGLESASESTPNQGTRTGGTDDIDIGHRLGSFEANIKIGQYRLYNRSLNSAQVAQNYLATKNDYPNGINGDIQGATFQGGSTPSYFDFNGSTNYVDVAYTTLGDRDFTLSMYIEFHDLSDQNYIWTKYLGNPSGQFGTLVQSQASRSTILWQMFDTSNGTPIFLRSLTDLSTGTYYHLSFVYVKETSATIYLNGSADGTTSYGTSGPFAQNSAQIRFGRYQTTSPSHDGEIGQIKIFDKALSASEVLAEYNATKTPYI